MIGIFKTIVNMSFAACFVIVAVILARALLSAARAPKKWSYRLWIAPAFRLLCPVSIASAFSLFRLIPQRPEAAAESAASSVLRSLDYIPGSVRQAVPSVPVSSVPPVLSTASPVLPTAVPAAVQTAVPAAVQTAVPANAAASSAAAAQFNADTVWTILMIVWLAGIAALTVIAAINYFRLSSLVRTAVKAEKVKNCRVYLSENIASPFILGLFRPRIYIPYGLTEAEKAYVLAHEGCHIRRGDHIVKPLAFAILAVHWFDPLCWAAFFMMERDLEMSCDEKVLSERSEKGVGAEYSTALLSFAAGKRFPAPNPLAFGETAVRSRIKNAMKYKKPKLFISVLAALLCIAVVAACVVNPTGTNTNNGNTDAPTEIPATEAPATEVPATEVPETEAPYIPEAAVLDEVLNVGVGASDDQLGIDMDAEGCVPEGFLISDGSIAILDSVKNRVLIYENSSLVRAIALSEESGFYGYGYSIAKAGSSLFVLNITSEYVFEYDWLTGAFIGKYPVPGKSREGADFSGWLVELNGRVYLADYKYNLADVLDPDASVPGFASVKKVSDKNWVWSTPFTSGEHSYYAGKDTFCYFMGSDSFGNAYFEVYRQLDGMDFICFEPFLLRFSPNGEITGYAAYPGELNVQYAHRHTFVTEEGRVFEMVITETNAVIYEVTFGSSYDEGRYDELIDYYIQKHHETETPDLDLPTEEWLVDNSWHYAELANRVHGYRFTKEQRELYFAQSMLDWCWIKYITDDNDVMWCIFYYSSNAGEWRLEYGNINSDLSGEEWQRLSERYMPQDKWSKEVPLVGLEIRVTAAELEAAGCHLSGGELTDEELAAIAAYRAKLLTAQYVNCSEDNALRCYEAVALEPQPSSVSDYSGPYFRSFILFTRPVEPRLFSNFYGDIGCDIAGDEWGEYAGWFCFGFHVEIIVEDDGSFKLTTWCISG